MPTTAWFLAPILIVAGYVVGRARRRGIIGPAPRTPTHPADALVVDATRITQHLHATVLQLADELNQYRQSLTRSANESGPPGDSEFEPALIAATQQLTQQLATTRSEIHEHVRRLINAADPRFDPATGLGSQREANRWLDTLLALMARYGNQFSVAIVSVDSVRAGDQDDAATNSAMNELGHLLRQATRETDIVARYGEDELLVIMPETNEQGAKVMAQRVTHQVAEELGCSISLGVASAMEGDSHKTLIHRADAALFAAQDEYGGGACQHTGLDLQPITLSAPQESLATTC